MNNKVSIFNHSKGFLLLSVVLIVYFFKNTLETVSNYLQVLPILVSSIVIFSLFLYIWFYRLKLSLSQVYIYLLIIYYLFLVLIFDFVSIVSHSLIPLFALVQYLIAPLFLFLFFEYYKNRKEKLFNSFIYILIFLSIINSIGGIVQYHISSDLFGLITNNTYVEIKEHVTKRAISFLASPQAMGLFTALSFCLILIKIKNKFFKSLLLALTFYTGVLTGSKIFILFVMVYIFLYSIKNILQLILSIILLFGVFILLQSLGNETFNRLLMIGNTVNNIEEYGTFLIWVSFIFYETEFLQFLFGHGFGVITTAAQSFYSYQILNGSAESFILQLYFETGIIGVCFFLYLYIKSIFNFYNSKYRPYAYILISLSVSLLGTPAFFGFTMSFIMYFFIVYGYLITTNKNRKYLASQ